MKLKDYNKIRLSIYLIFSLLFIITISLIFLPEGSKWIDFAIGSAYGVFAGIIVVGITYKLKIIADALLELEGKKKEVVKG